MRFLLPVLLLVLPLTGAFVRLPSVPRGSFIQTRYVSFCLPRQHRHPPAHPSKTPTTPYPQGWAHNYMDFVSCTLVLSAAAPAHRHLLCPPLSTTQATIIPLPLKTRCLCLHPRGWHAFSFPSSRPAGAPTNFCLLPSRRRQGKNALPRLPRRPLCRRCRPPSLPPSFPYRSSRTTCAWLCVSRAYDSYPLR